MFNLKLSNIMAVFYKLRQFGNPQDTSEEKKYFAQPYFLGTLETRDLANIVAKRSGHSPGQLIGLFQDYFLQIEEHILAGQTVEMAPIGIVLAYFNGVGAESEEAYDTENITRIHLVLRPSVETKKHIQTVDGGGDLELKKYGE